MRTRSETFRSGEERLDSSLMARWPFSTCWLSFINDLHAQIYLAARRNERVDRRSNPRRLVMHRVIPWLAPRLEFIDFRFVAIASFSPTLSISLFLTIYLPIFFYLSSAEFPLVISKLEWTKVARNFSLTTMERKYFRVVSFDTSRPWKAQRRRC